METPQQVHFGTDGIRGVAGEFPLDPNTVLLIGRAIGTWLNSHAARGNDAPCALIGRDTRRSGHMLLHMLAGGLLSEGVNVCDLGIITTPGVAFSTRRLTANVGIVISASHNPFEQNGIKLFGPDGFKPDDAQEETIEGLIASSDTQPPVKTLGRFESERAEHVQQYIRHLSTATARDALRNLTLVVDCANGAASPLTEETFRQAGVQHIVLLNADPDGENINVQAGSEHVRRNRADLLNAVQTAHADLGIAFDGDADRVVFVTPEGMLLDGDHTLGILALELAERGRLRNKTVVATDMSNRGLEDFLAAHDIALSRAKVGDRYVMERLQTGGFTLGGEQAGHVIILDPDRGLTAGDGLYVALLVAAIAARNKQNGGPTLHELASRIVRYPQVIASAHLARGADLKTIEELPGLQQAILEAFGGRGRVNVRFSGTEPRLLRAMVEGGPETTMQQVINAALELCGVVARATDSASPRIDLVDCASGAPIVLPGQT